MARHGVTRVRDRIRAVLNEDFFSGISGISGEFPEFSGFCLGSLNSKRPFEVDPSSISGIPDNRLGFQ